MDFDTFARSHPKPHVVAAHLVDEFSSAELASLSRRLNRLASSSAGAHAGGWVRTTTDTEFQLRFEREEDALVFAACFTARPVASNGFASQRRFTLDRALFEGLKVGGDGRVIGLKSTPSPSSVLER